MSENYYADTSNAEITRVELETPTPTEEVAAAAIAAIGAVQNRSFSDRNPELGKMVKCQVCRTRHRSSIKCEQKFKVLWVEEDLETGEKTTVYAMAQQPEGVEIPHQISAQQPTLKQIVGAAAFKSKRNNLHPSKRNMLLIEKVRSLLPTEYTEDDLKKARTKARRVLANKYGRHGFLPPIWQVTKPEAPVVQS